MAGGRVEGGISLHSKDAGQTYAKQGAAIRGQSITSMSFVTPTHGFATAVNSLQICSLLEFGEPPASLALEMTARRNWHNRSCGKNTPLFIRMSSSVLTLGGNCPFAQLSPVNSPFGRQIPRGGLLKSVHLRTKFPRQFHCAHGPLVAPIALALERIQ